jgi:hypothetical protein
VLLSNGKGSVYAFQPTVPANLLLDPLENDGRNDWFPFKYTLHDIDDPIGRIAHQRESGVRNADAIQNV